MMAFLVEATKQPLMTLAVAAIAYSMCVFGLLLALFVGRTVLKLPDEKLAIQTIDVLATGAPFSALGVVVGYLTGISRAAAVGTVLPAVLTLLGASALFIASEGGRKGQIASIAIIFLSIALITGADYGSRLRYQYETALTSFEAKRHEAHIELQLKKYRKMIGLDQDPVKVGLPQQ